MSLKNLFSQKPYPRRLDTARLSKVSSLSGGFLEVISVENKTSESGDVWLPGKELPFWGVVLQRKARVLSGCPQTPTGKQSFKTQQRSPR